MKVLILGGGGREHALAWKIAQSQLCDTLYAAPGNPGIAKLGKNLDINPLDFEAIKKAVLEYGINMLVVGPEAPLVDGISDFFKSEPELQSVMVIGPGKTGAQLEGSKDFAKAFMGRHKIPTAAYRTFTISEVNAAREYLATLEAPYVLKADGLAAGKGVVILNDLEEAQKEVEAMLADAKFGAASSRVVIENFLAGIEVSVFALTDGKDYVLLPNAKDYKRIGEGDTGLNTGGMGAVSPVPFADSEFMAKVEERIVKPTVKGIQQEGIDYVGFIFFGLIKVGEDPYVIEYNVRLGDPETEAVLPRIESDLLELLQAAGNGSLSGKEVKFSNRKAATVMTVSGGYPEKYEKGKKINLPDTDDNVLLFHAGTATKGEELATNGGRVIAATGMDSELAQALKKAYRLAGQIEFEGKYFRRDIGKDLA